MSGFEIAAILGMTAVTFSIRYSFFALGDKVRFPPVVKRALHYVPVAVLTAIVVPMVLLPDGFHWQIDWRNPWLIGASTTALIVWRWNRLLAGIAGGMIAFFVWGWWLG